MKHKILKVTKEQKELAHDMMFKCLNGKTIDIKDSFMHKVAEQLVLAKVAVVTLKKNYGHIAQIKGIKDI